MTGSLISMATALQELVTTLHPVELYTFSCEELAKQQRIVPEVDESFLGPLQIPNSDLFECHSSGQGISPIDFQFGDSISRDTVPLIESENTVSSLLEHIMTTEEPGLSIELWFTPSSVNESISDAVPEKNTACHGIQDMEVCNYFAQSTYVHGPITCMWYEKDQDNETTPDDSYCGFPGNRFAYQGATFRPWDPPIRYCNSRVTSKHACEKSHFFAPQPCYWDGDHCRPQDSDYAPPIYPKLPLVSIAEGDSTERDRRRGCPGTGHNFDFRLIQKGRSFTVSHSGFDQWTCNYNYNPLQMMMPRSPELTQVVVVMNNTVAMGTSVFMNGNLVDKPPEVAAGLGGFDDWNPTMFLQLFSDYDTWHLSKHDAKYMPPFLGGIHLLGIYDKQLSPEEVEVAYRNGKQLLSTFS